MSAIHATWKNGQVQLDTSVNWPEGCRLVITEDKEDDLVFMTEEEQSDDPQAIERWIAEFRALPPLEMTPEQEREMLEWRKKVKEYNLEAVRRQMAEGFE